MGKAALAALALISFALIIAATFAQVEAVALEGKVFFQGSKDTVCKWVDGNKDFTGLKPFPTCAMAYGGKLLRPEQTCDLPLVRAWLSGSPGPALSGLECAKAVNDWWPPFYRIEGIGVFDYNIGQCLLKSSCTGGVPSQALSCGSTAVVQLCSKAVCETQVSAQCDGKAPNAVFSDGGKCTACQYIPPRVDFDFTLTMSPSSATVNKGNSVPVSISLEKTQGTAALVPISCTVVSSVSNRPTCSVSITSGGSGSSCTPNNVCGGTMTVRTTSSTPDGTYTVRLSANGGLNAPKTRDFSLTVSPTSELRLLLTANPLNGGEVNPGSPSTSQIGVLRTTGPVEAVRVSCQPLNFGITCKLNGVTMTSSNYVECTPRPSCPPVNLEVSSVIPGPYTVRVNGRGAVTTGATGFVDYKFSVKSPGTLLPPPSSTTSTTSPPPTTYGTQYGFTLSVEPKSFTLLKGTTKQFTATVTKSTTETRYCDVAMSILANYDVRDLDRHPPKDLTVNLDKSSCILSPSSPTCSVKGTVRTTGNTPASEYDRYYVKAVCRVDGRDRERNERLDIKVVPDITSISVSPASGSTVQGGTTNAIATVLRVGDSRYAENRNVPVYCTGLPAGAACSFSGSVPAMFDSFDGFSGGVIDDFGWIRNALETNVVVSQYGKTGRFDQFMQLIGAPHTSATVTKSVTVPPLEGRRLFISFDYKLQNSFGPCKSSYRFCSSCRTCSYDENTPAPSQAVVTIRGASIVSEGLNPGAFTPVSSGQSCSSSYWGRSCRETFSLAGQGGASIGSVRKETDWTYYFSQCRSSGCPEVTYSGGYDTPWRTYSREITALASNTEKRPIEVTFQNMRWGTRYDVAFINSHYTSVDNVRIYAEPGFGGCVISTYSSSLGGWTCSVPVTISTQQSTPTGANNLNILATDGYNWFTQYRYGNIYYDWVTGKSPKFTEISATTPYSLTVSGACNNDGICALSETQESCPSDCSTKVAVDPKELTAGQTIKVNVDFTDGRYVAGTDVGLNLEIETVRTGVRTVWDATNGCIYGSGTRRTVAWWPESVSENGRFATTFYCVIPFAIGGGDKALHAIPIIYP